MNKTPTVNNPNDSISLFSEKMSMLQKILKLEFSIYDIIKDKLRYFTITKENLLFNIK